MAAKQLAERYPEGVPWYLAEKSEIPAQAALLGLLLKVGPDGTVRLRASAIGDACLLQSGDGGSISTYPISHASSFGNDPVLLPAIERPLAALIKPDPFQTTASVNDSVFLATDAIAAWYIGESERGRKPWKQLEAPLVSEDAFASFVNTLRDSGQLKNDDVTLLRLCFI